MHDRSLLTYILFLDPDKNFALEKYGPHSRCFDHTNDMWEERTCKQARQWQHWGSGCYLYKCEIGRLHIMVSLLHCDDVNAFIKIKYKLNTNKLSTNVIVMNR